MWPFQHTIMGYLDSQDVSLKFCCHNRLLNCSTIPMAVSSSVAKRHLLGAVVDEARQSGEMEMHSEPNCLSSSSYYTESSSEVGELTGQHAGPPAMCSMKELKETLRRRRIGLANKGRVPWNKGRKHSPETCALIKERTLEAMRDPKIKKKMSETPRLHSEQSKKKIGSSLKQLWAERLKWKHSRERFYSSWAVSIAEAARRGGIGEEQLDWDSYEKLKEDIAFRQLQRHEEKAKKKEVKKIQAEKRAQEKTENIARLALKKLEHKQKAKPRAKQKAIRSCKTREQKKELPISREQKDQLPLSRELNLKLRLKKIDGKKLIDGPSCPPTGVMTYLESALEKFDIETIKEEQRRKTISLADQIQAAKSKRHRLSSGSMSKQHWRITCAAKGVMLTKLLILSRK